MEQSPEYHTLESDEIGTSPVVLTCLIDVTILTRAVFVLYVSAG